MDKINFQNGITPLNDTNLNQMQTNVETAINETKEVFEETLGLWEGNSTNGLKIKKYGNIVNLVGEISGLGATHHIIAKLTRYMPNGQIHFNPYINDNTLGVAYVDSNGYIVLKYKNNNGGTFTTTDTSNINVFWTV